VDLLDHVVEGFVLTVEVELVDAFDVQLLLVQGGDVLFLVDSVEGVFLGFALLFSDHLAVFVYAHVDFLFLLQFRLQLHAAEHIPLQNSVHFYVFALKQVVKVLQLVLRTIHDCGHV